MPWEMSTDRRYVGLPVSDVPPGLMLKCPHGRNGASNLSVLLGSPELCTAVDELLLVADASSLPNGDHSLVKCLFTLLQSMLFWRHANTVNGVLNTWWSAGTEVLDIIRSYSLQLLYYVNIATQPSDADEDDR